ncbi:MAG: F0F1 ATP synthase subunit alpha, partial [Oscillospiraceae bacterium]
MKLQINEISSAISSSINAFDTELEVAEVGTVTRIADGVAQISGLDNAMVGELLLFDGGVKGMVLNLEPETVGAIVIGQFTSIRQGSIVRRSGRTLDVPVGEALLGRVVNALGEPIDGMGPVDCKEKRAVESNAPGVISRTPVCRPLQTGLKAVDSMVPIGKGQRELIIGDRQTGKTSIALDAIINQKGKNVICIYVAIGQKESTVSSVVKMLAETDALAYTTVVSCTAGEPAAMQYIAPYAGCAMGEYFMYKGHDVLIIYDDLSKQ